MSLVIFQALTSSRRRGWRLVLIALGTSALAVGLVVAARRERALTWPEIIEATRERNWPQVEAGLTRWIAEHPDDLDARLMLGTTRLTRGVETEAAAVLNALPEGTASWGQGQALLAEEAIRRRDAPRAERLLRTVVARDPMAFQPRQRLIYLLSLQQRTAEAREVFWELYRISNDPRMLMDLVHELFAWENDVRGIPPEIDEFLAVTPEDLFLRRVKGLSLLLTARPAEALPHLEAAARGLVDDPDGRYALAECLHLLGRFDGDPSILGPVPDAPAAAARWWSLKARLEESLGRDADAEASLNQALRAAPRDREAHYRLGQLLARLGRGPEAQTHRDTAQAIRDRQQAVRREHERLRRQGFDATPELFERLGALCQDAGFIPEARAWFEQALRLDPLRASAQQALARTPPADPRAFPIFLARPTPAEAPTAETMPPHLASSLETPRERLRFEDVTDRSGITFQYDSGASEALHLADTIGGGVGLIDFDGDGWLDLYFVNGCALPFDTAAPPRPNRLYRNRRDGTFEDVTDRAGVAGFGYGMGCTVADYDRDGHDDLFVTGFGRTVLYRNRGDGTFEDVTDRAGVASKRWTTAAGFADLDADGDLDLVVIGYVVDDLTGMPCRDAAGHPIHCPLRHYQAQDDHLFRNNGDGTFTDIAVEAGFVGPDGRGLGLAIADLDEDGRLDLYVANDASADFLFLNRGGSKFEEVGLSSGVAFDAHGKPTASMGVVADDLDGDGLIDLLHTNFLNESVTLHRNAGGGFFQDATLASGLDAPTRSRTGFGVAAFDADDDGRLDLFIANGHVDHQPWMNAPMAQRPQFFLGDDHGRFRLAGTSAASYLERAVVGRGLAAGDLDNDGRVDLVIVHRDAPVTVLRNVSETGHWLGLRLRGAPVGAVVHCHADGRSQSRWVTTGTGYLSQHDPRLWFGLGNAQTVERLEVSWPSGARQTFEGLAPDRILELVEGQPPTEP